MYDPSDAQSHNLQASVYLSEALDISTKLSYSKPTLETAQILLGLVSLLRSTAMPRPARMFVSVAVRILQDLGAHMEPSNGNKPSPQVEDLGRVFWIAYIHDKAIATHTGTVSKRFLAVSQILIPDRSLPSSTNKTSRAFLDCTIAGGGR